MKFNNYPEISAHLVDCVVSALPKRPEFEVEEGFSNVSCSAYVNVVFWELDEDGDQLDAIGDCKVRFSDHGDRYGSDLSLRFDDVLDSDELGDVELADWRIEEMVAQAVAFIEREFEEQAND